MKTTKKDLVKQVANLSDQLSIQSQLVNEKVEALRKRDVTISERDQEIQSLKYRIASMTLEHVSKLEAVKMLFDLMSSGQTHRSKGMFAEHANLILSAQIEKSKQGFSFHENDLPF